MEIGKVGIDLGKSVFHLAGTTQAESGEYTAPLTFTWRQATSSASVARRYGRLPGPVPDAFPSPVSVQAPY